ncbi:MAG: ATP phosphoribosyltransferase regulatory subunit [Alphaproteobacteria bacterium]|nr:MAG: ATP phosphoribosyltransferase regulatory subunit [Alphaproteobacteria bacterium]
MTDYSERALLPEGFHDTLAPDAEYEASVRARLLARFAAFGYDRVAPPLVEFEESLLAGAGHKLARRMFRVMDPTTQRMMGLRSDMTIQVARIAATRLAADPRPLRLCYAGQVLRVQGGQLRTEREFGQAGIELIGSESLEADVEVLLLASEALKAVGVPAVSIDLTVPTLAPAIAEAFGLDAADAEALRAALNNKDIGRLEAVDGVAGDLFRGLLTAAGPADEALVALQGLQLPDAARTIVDDLAALVERLAEVAPDQTFTIDPGEFRGFEYKTGIGFTLFADNVRGELGRGGRYEIERADGSREPATGFTLYIDSLLRALPAASPIEKLYVPWGTRPEAIASLHERGWRTVRALEPIDDDRAEAIRLGCSHILQNDKVVALA